MSKRKVIGGTAILAVIVFAAIFGIMSLVDNAGKTTNQITAEQTVEELNRYVDKKVDVKKVEHPTKGTVDLEASSLQDELPEIGTYFYKVEGKGEVNIEIFSSPEKAGRETMKESSETDYNTWLVKVVEDFNKQGYTTSDGKTVSVSLRSISSGVMVDYIVSGKSVPDAITPSNECWISMLKAHGVTLTQETESLVRNVAGIVLNKETYNKITEKYGSVNLETIVEATINNEIAMGYTNPYASSAGINFLMSELLTFDSSNPLSEEAIANFQAFQANVPVVSYNTVQMQGAIDSGVLDAMILEYQGFANKPALRNYVFVPFGVRHDNPLYSIGDLSADKKEVMKLFVDFATSQEAQESAKEYGFDGHSDYVPEVRNADGNTLLDAQQLWKNKKDNGQEIVAVFIIDTSGSVDGAPLNAMKESLINAGQYINSENYVGLVTYNSDVTINLPIAKFDLNHRAYFNGEINGLSGAGGTRTFDAIAVGLQMLEQSKADHPDAKFMLFVLSDGNSDGSLEKVSPFIENLNVPIYTIGYNANIDALKKISQINEAASINADTDDIIYSLKNLFNAQM